MIRAILERVSKRLRKKTIVDECSLGAGPLLFRYELLRTRWMNLYLHHFLRSDNDRHFHDHPWWFASVVLAGNYIEHTPSKGDVYRGLFSVRYRPALWKHWVEIGGESCWTLIAVGRRQRTWGFYTEAGWVPYTNYDCRKGYEAKPGWQGGNDA